MWKTVKLESIYEVGSSKRVLKSQWRESGVAFYRGREITRLSINSNVENELFIEESHYDELVANYGAPQKDDIMITAIGTIGNTYIVNENDKFYFKDASVLWLKRKSDADSRYVNYWLKSEHFKSQLDRGNGATVDTLTIRKLQSVEIPLPPLAEQHKIVEKLDIAFEEIDGAIAATERRREEFERYCDKIVSEIISDIFNRYENVPLCQITERITKGSSPKWQGIKYVEDPGVLFVTSENVGKNKLLLDKKKYVEEEFNKKDSKSILKFGDVLTNIVGASIGRTCVFNIHDVIANINQAVCLIRVRADYLNASFLTHLLNSRFYTKILHDSETSMARANLSLGFFSKLTIPTPPIDEQNSLSENLSKIDLLRVEFLENGVSKIRKLNELKSAILAQELKGPES